MEARRACAMRSAVGYLSSSVKTQRAAKSWARVASSGKTRAMRLCKRLMACVVCLTRACKRPATSRSRAMCGGKGSVAAGDSTTAKPARRPQQERPVATLPSTARLGAVFLVSAQCRDALGVRPQQPPQDGGYFMSGKRLPTVVHLAGLAQITSAVRAVPENTSAVEKQTARLKPPSPTDRPCPASLSLTTSHRHFKLFPQRHARGSVQPV